MEADGRFLSEPGHTRTSSPAQKTPAIGSYLHKRVHGALWKPTSPPRSLKPLTRILEETEKSRNRTSRSRERERDRGFQPRSNRASRSALYVGRERRETERKSSPPAAFSSFVFSVLFEGVGSGGVLAEVGPAAGAGGPHGCCALLELQIRFRHWIEGVEAVEAMATAGAATDTGSLECLGCNAVKSSLFVSPPFFRTVFWEDRGGDRGDRGGRERDRGDRGQGPEGLALWVPTLCRPVSTHVRCTEGRRVADSGEAVQRLGCIHSEPDRRSLQPHWHREALAARALLHVV